MPRTHLVPVGPRGLGVRLRHRRGQRGTRGRDPLSTAATLVAYSRVHTGVHYPMRAIQDEVRFPFTAALVGTSIVVTGVDFDGDERRGIFACVARPTTQLRVYNPN